MKHAVLAVDTAAPVIGVATSVEGVDASALPAFSARAVRGADRLLAPALAEQLAWLDARGIEPAAVAVSVGPGGFTGLRVGVATALGVAVARGLPVLPVSSLWARACLVEGPCLALLDARKGKVYAARFELGPDGLPRPLGEEADQPLTDALSGEPLPVVGEGAVAFAEALAEAGWAAVVDPARSPAPALACAALRRLDEAVDAGAVALRYLRPPDARLPGSRPPPPAG